MFFPVSFVLSWFFLCFVSRLLCLVFFCVCFALFVWFRTCPVLFLSLFSLPRCGPALCFSFCCSLGILGPWRYAHFRTHLCYLGLLDFSALFRFASLAHRRRHLKNDSGYGPTTWHSSTSPHYASNEPTPGKILQVVQNSKRFFRRPFPVVLRTSSEPIFAIQEAFCLNFFFETRASCVRLGIKRTILSRLTDDVTKVTVIATGDPSAQNL